MRARFVLGGLVLTAGALVVAGCVVTMSYDDYGDQETGASSDAGNDAYVCVPKTCADKSANCGDVPDDCGKVLKCGECGNGETCGGAGPNQCGTGPCQPATCNSLGAFCGTASDGCGKTLECGNCQEPKICGGAGLPNQCGCENTITCREAQAECGPISDGCGGTTDCGTCQPGMKCSTDNSAGMGSANECVCADDPCLQLPELQAECGSVPNCFGDSTFCPCPSGADCQVTGPGTLGMCP